MNELQLNRALLEKAQSALPDDALRAVRENALSEFVRQGIPTTRDEDWRYTNLSNATKLSEQWLESIAANAATGVHGKAELPAIDAYPLLVSNGQVDDAMFAAVQSATNGVLQLRRLRDAADQVSADGPMDAFNAALLQDGLHITVAAGQTLDKPLAIFIADGGPAASQTRLVIQVADNASIDIVEYHTNGTPDEHFANTVTQLGLAAGARANIVRVQNRNSAQSQVGKLNAKVQRDATLDYASVDLGGSMIRQDVVADITGTGALVSLHGLYLATDKQFIDNHTRVDHRVGPANSREEYRGILNGRARCVFNGKAVVHKGADGTDAQQANHNLLLSDKAEVDTKPELEIYAEDVKCSHGATVGQLDKTALFYMQSRGLDREQAAHLLTRAFAAQILAKLPIKSLHAHIETLVDAKLDVLLEDASQ
ncbi:Fe-S cluster assembly protein SufD [Woeseia oceani]|uniref:Fe-S cluster assembly protein SufD n=1 Tax=Woeseia oceani TaxID=1548547 RepID=A0A193LGK2_9GAMM|nr:Fe-S cluster assembly protein SufD [Woeseia oceani]ANO51588.1 Fe-S cluster assembly protein SufD [Woeseia oceani]